MLFYGLPRQSGEVDSLMLSFLFVFLYVLVSVFILFLCNVYEQSRQRALKLMHGLILR